MGCSFRNGLLPPCFLVWKSCLTQRASETSIFPLKRIQVSLSQCFPVRDIFREVPSMVRRDGLVPGTGRSWLCGAGAHMAESPPGHRLCPIPASLCSHRGSGRTQQVGRTSPSPSQPTPPQKSPCPSPATLGPTGQSQGKGWESRATGRIHPPTRQLPPFPW